MDPRAIDKAKRRLNSARKAMEELKTCRDLEQFHETWFAFLTAAKSIYTALETGSKISSPQSRQWFGGKQRERREDALLQYVYQARNDEEHGLDTQAEMSPGYFGIRVKRGYSTSIVGSMKDGVFTFASTDGKPMLLETMPEHISLKAVTGRGGEIFRPPNTHLGQRIDFGFMPLPVAEKAIAYLASMVAEAEQLA